MEQRIKLIRFTSGEQVVAELIDDGLAKSEYKLKLGSTYKVIQQTTKYGVSSSLVKWMPMRESAHVWVSTKDISTIVDVGDDTVDMIRQFQSEEEEYAELNQIMKDAVRQESWDEESLEELYEYVMQANTGKIIH